MKRITYPELNLGDVARAHGACFEIIEVVMYRQDADHKAKYGDMGPTVCAKGRWLNGAVVKGYFGPGVDWTFQGNKGAEIYIEEN